MNEEEYVIVSKEMVSRGLLALREESFAVDQAELVTSIYMAMRYQEIRESASDNNSLR